MKSKDVTHHTGYDGDVFSTVEDQIETLRTSVAAVLGQCPVGTVLDYAGTAAPTYWLLCYGQEVSQTTYAALYAVLSTTFNTGGEGAGNFRLPDMRGRMAAGQDDMGGSSANRLTGITNGVNGDTLGAAGGLESTGLAQANLPTVNLSHSLSVDTTLTNGTAVIRGVISGVDVASGIAATVQQTSAIAAYTVSLASGTVSGTVALGGSGTVFNNLPPVLILNKIIYAGV
jgi:microcystin-dependent protein